MPARNRLVTHGIWKTLASSARGARNPAYAAVAYFGKGASKLLPLRPNSALVVDASDVAVKSGQTCPFDLKRLQKRGVRIYSAQNLHAKIYVFDHRVFLGSANASSRSAGTLIEAMLQSNDRGVVSAARTFVRSLCLDELSPKTLSRLTRIYRPPRLPNNVPRGHSARRKIRTVVRRLLLGHMFIESPPAEAKQTQQEGWQIAKRKQKHVRSYVLDDFWIRGNSSYRVGDKIIQVTDESPGHVLVTPPADVIHIRRWRRRNRRIAFVYLEHPKMRRIRVETLARRIGYGAKKELRRDGLVRD
jgi:hypothetical protein